MKNLTLRQLAHFRGEQPNDKIYVAIRGEVFDVTVSRHLYGKGGAYEILAGCEIARALAMFDLEETGSDKTSDLNKDQMLTLKEWTEKFQTKYKTVGKIVGPLSLGHWKRVFPMAVLATGAVAVALLFIRKR